MRNSSRGSSDCSLRENKQQVPLLTPPGGVSWSLKWRGVGADGWLRLEQWLRYSAHPVDSAVCRPPLLLSIPQKWQLGFGLLYLTVHTLLQLSIHAVILSFLWLLCVLMLRNFSRGT